MDKGTMGFVYAAISSVLVSFMFVFTKMILREVNPESANVYVFGIGSIVSFLFLLILKKAGKLGVFKNYWKPILILGLLAGIGSLLWFYAIDILGPSLTAFLLRLLTVFTVLWGIIFFKERFNTKEIFGMALAIAGTLAITYVSGKFLLLGVVFVIVDALFFSIVQVITKKYAERVDPFVMNHFRIMFTFLIAGAYALLAGKIQPPTPTVLLFSFLGTTFGGVIGIGLFYKALELSELSKVNIIRTMDPFVIVILSLLILGDVPSLQQLMGGLIMVVGIVVLILSRRKPKIVSDSIS